MEKHVHFIGILWIVFGALSLIGGFITFSILFGISFIPSISYEAHFILRTIGLYTCLVLAIFSIPKLVAGIGLMKKKEWARILTLIISFLCLLNFPLGTALGIYSFVILLKDETIQLFRMTKKEEGI